MDQRRLERAILENLAIWISRVEQNVKTPDPADLLGLARDMRQAEESLVRLMTRALPNDDCAHCSFIRGYLHDPYPPADKPDRSDS